MRGSSSVPLVAAADRLDRWRWSPQQVASRAVERFEARRGELASKDPQWCQLRDTAHQPVTADGLFSMLERFEAAAERAEQLMPSPWWFRPARSLSKFRVGRTARELTWVVQRARRGWADCDVWSMHTHLVKMVAPMLRELAVGRGWPSSDEFPTPESWSSALCEQADALDRWLDVDDSRAELTSRWAEAARSGDQTHAGQLFDELTELERRHGADATAALRWVADHFENLWD